MIRIVVSTYPPTLTYPTLSGSQRERCERVAAALFSRVIARATHLDDGAQVAVVPLHERLGHCGEAGANVRLVCGDPNPNPLTLTLTLTPTPTPTPTLALTP